jgi:hypothetical protein
MGKQSMQIREMAPEPVAPAPAVPKSSVMGKVTADDFFRLKRKSNGWIIETVRVAPDDATRRDIHEWDLYETTERRLRSLAADAERER